MKRMVILVVLGIMLLPGIVGAADWTEIVKVKGDLRYRHEMIKIEGNDAEAIAKIWDIYCELMRAEYTVPELSKTIYRLMFTKCPHKTGYKDINEWNLIFMRYIAKGVNPKATVERPKGMCAGDPYCEYVHKIEE